MSDNKKVKFTSELANPVLTLYTLEIQLQSYSKLILKRLMKIRYFKFFSEFSKGSIIRGQFPDS